MEGGAATASRNTVEYLEELLDQARSGELIGLAGVLHYRKGWGRVCTESAAANTEETVQSLRQLIARLSF